jgi:O-antigen/teichoic acid export membrane protein
MVGAAPFALVNLAYSLLGSMGFLMGIFQRIAFASFSRMHDEAGRLNRIAERLLWILCLAYIPLDFGIGGFSSFWVPLVYGDKWRGMADLMPWCVVPTVLVVLASVFYSSALAGGANRLVFQQNGLNAVLYVGVMVALAKPLGVYAWPLAQLAAVPAAWLFVRFHFTHYGKVSIARVGWGFGAGILWMASTVMLLRADRPASAVALAVLFLALWLWRMGKGLRLEDLARKVLRSGV